MRNSEICLQLAIATVVCAVLGFCAWEIGDAASGTVPGLVGLALLGLGAVTALASGAFLVAWLVETAIHGRSGRDHGGGRETTGGRSVAWAAGLTALGAVFVGIGFSRGPSQAREKARRINCASCMKNLGLSSRMYSGDFDEHFPPDLAALIRQDYLTTLKLYTCPSTDTRPAESFEEFQTGGHCDYLYFGKGLTEGCMGHDPDRTILGCDKPGNHRGYFTVWFATGRVRGYAGKSIEEIADQNGLFLPGYNTLGEASTEDALPPE